MADPDLGWTDLGVRPDASGFGRDLDRQLGPQMQTVGRSAASRFSAGFRRAATVGAAGAGLLALKVGKDSIDQASDLNESLNAVNVTYRKQAAEVKALGREAAESLGLSNTEFNGLSVQFSGFVNQIAGGEGKKVVGTLDDLTTRAADFASVMNLDVAESARLFQSGLAGETEPLRRFGIDLSAAAVQANAYKTGIAEAGEELTEQEKVQSRYSLLMQETSKAQGDFANTSDSLANRQRILNARWDDARAELGESLLPLVEDFTGFLIDDGIPAVEKFAKWFSDEGVPAIKDFADEVEPAVGAVKDLAGFLSDLPSEAKLAGVIALVGGLGAAKLRGGSGLTGSIGSAIGVMKPVPVLVTNPGFGAGAGVPGAGGKVPPVAPVPPSGALGKIGNLSKLGALTIGGATVAVTLASGAGVLEPGQARDVGDSVDQEAFRRNIAEAMAAGEDVRDAIRLYEDEFGVAFESLSVSARNALRATAAEFQSAKLPTELKTQIALQGVPESKRAVRDLIAQYDLTPRQKRTVFEIFGYDLLMDRAARINKALDWAARDRRARISVEYESQGYETRGGLQRGGGTSTTQTGRSRAGGGLG